MMGRWVLSFTLLLGIVGGAWARQPVGPADTGGLNDGLSGATVLIVRHAEKPDSGRDLTPEGDKRAKAYADYFRRFEIDGARVKIDALVATTDTAKSDRPRLTLEPLSHASGLPLQQPCDDKDVQCVRGWLALQPAGRTTLIAWHHGQIPNLIAALGGDPSRWLPGGAWPPSIYSWVVVLRYDAQGRLIYTNLVHEPEALNR